MEKATVAYTEFPSLFQLREEEELKTHIA